MPGMFFKTQKMFLRAFAEKPPMDGFARNFAQGVVSRT